MASHKFRVGQMVGFDPSLSAGDRPSRRGYKILRLLLRKGGECCYQIKTIEEPLERVVRESELVLHSSLLTHHDGVAPGALAGTRRRDVHVARGPKTTWLVRRGSQPAELVSYRLKAHAMAFARALAFSTGVDMIVHDLDGVVTRYSRASLTYPTWLD